MLNQALVNWDPENKTQWQANGRGIAQRNLWISIPCLMLAFIIWTLWSILVVNLPKVGFSYTQSQLFLLTALPALSGATLRIFYSFIVPVVGGRRWTTLSTASLLIPAIGIGMAVQDPTTPYSTMVILALLCGFGGGNFSSSMANINFFFPKAEKGLATGLNAGLGNLGVSVVQLIAPLVITTAIFGAFAGEPQIVTKGDTTTTMWLQNAGYIWVPFIIVSTIAAWFGMNDVASCKASFADQMVIFKRKHNWIMCWLYLGTFGSFIGFSAAFPMLIKTQFPEVNVAQFAFLGPLVGAVIRPVGGWVSDKIGGAKVTFWVFVLLAIGSIAVMYTLPSGGNPGNFSAFLTVFLVLFTLTGIGNGSTFRMIPIIFLTLYSRLSAGKDEKAQKQAMSNATKESAAVLGFSGAIGAYGGFFIPKSFGSSIAATGSVNAALTGFVVFYVISAIINWWYYSRPKAEVTC